MIKIFTTNQNGKIEFTKQELLDFIEEIKQECRKEEHQIDPINSPVLPNHPNWTITPYCTIKSDDSVDDIRIREDRGGIFNELLKELGC